MLGYNLARFGKDPTGIATSQALRYNIGGGPTTNRMQKMQRSTMAGLGVTRTKAREDARISTFLQNLAQRALGATSGGNRGRGRTRMIDQIGRQSMGTPNAAGQKRNMLQKLYEEFQKAHDEANAANEERYKQLISGLEERRTRGLGYLDQVGNQMRADVEHKYRNLGSDVQQSMVDAGLSGGSAAQVMKVGVGRQGVEALNRVNEELALQRLNVDTSLDKDRLDAIERRQDVGPSYEMLANLGQQLGASQSQQAGYGQAAAAPAQGLAAYMGAPQFAPAGGAVIMGGMIPRDTYTYNGPMTRGMEYARDVQQNSHYLPNDFQQGPRRFVPWQGGTNQVDRSQAADPWKPFYERIRSNA